MTRNEAADMQELGLEPHSLVQRQMTVAAIVADAAPAPPANGRPRKQRSDAGKPKPKIVPTTQAENQRCVLHISFDLTPQEMASWEPQRIQDFFRGVAQALAAKGLIAK